MIDPLAEEILQRLARYPEASEIVLGGYFALQHYADYRQTRNGDVSRATVWGYHLIRVVRRLG